MAVWITCAGVVRVQGNATMAGGAAVPIEHLSFAVRDSGASLIVVATIYGMGSTVSSEEFGALLKGVSVATGASERETHDMSW